MQALKENMIVSNCFFFLLFSCIFLVVAVSNNYLLSSGDVLYKHVSSGRPHTWKRGEISDCIYWYLFGSYV